MRRDNDWVSAPADYEQLVRWYKTYLMNFLGQHGIRDDEREDVFQSILEVALKKGILEQFNPDAVFVYQGKEHKANFKGFITSFFKSYLPGWLDRQTKRQRREALICDTPVSVGADSGNPSTGAPWVELYGPSSPDASEQVIGEDVAATFRRYLENLPTRHAGDQLDMVAFLDYRLGQVERDGKVSNREVEAHFGRSHTCVNGWTWRLRAAFSDWSGTPLPAKKGSAPRRPVPPPPTCPPQH